MGAVPTSGSDLLTKQAEKEGSACFFSKLLGGGGVTIYAEARTGYLRGLANICLKCFPGDTCPRRWRSLCIGSSPASTAPCGSWASSRWTRSAFPAVKSPRCATGEDFHNLRFISKSAVVKMPQPKGSILPRCVLSRIGGAWVRADFRAPPSAGRRRLHRRRYPPHVGGRRRRRGRWRRERGRDSGDTTRAGGANAGRVRADAAAGGCAA